MAGILPFKHPAMKINSTHFIQFLLAVSYSLLCISCVENNKPPAIKIPADSANKLVINDSPAKTNPGINPVVGRINTGAATPIELLAFARTLIDVPYRYASADPDSGFDCSGFITHVFNHFRIIVPRASESFTHIEKEVALADARPGDLILFTGTDTAIHIVGHMGIIESITGNKISFIHASSGKANGVTISLMEDYYRSRFVKVIRVFKE